MIHAICYLWSVEQCRKRELSAWNIKTFVYLCPPFLKNRRNVIDN